MKTREYAEALVKVAHEEGEGKALALFEKLSLYLRARGQAKALPALLREVKEAVLRRKALSPVVEVADDSERVAALYDAAEAGITAEVAVVNPSLIRGWRARGEGVLVDHSAKRSLVDIYRRITS